MDTSPRTPRRTLVRLALAAIVVNVAIVLTGGIVRVTGSGLGCPEWPTCDGTQVVPQPGAEAGWHQAIEFGNRLITFVVLAVAAAVVVAVHRHARERRDVVRLAWGLPLGVVGQAILGGITVLTGLHPLVVAGHFLLSMVLIAVAVVLHDRVSDHPDGRATRRLQATTGVLLVLAVLVLVVGTLVTASGPHAGDPGTARLGVDIRTIARVHAGLVWATVATTVGALVLARRGEADSRVVRALAVLLGVELAQGAIGYLQYALGIPAWLVALHLLGASLFWVAALRVRLAARDLAPGDAAIEAPAPAAVTIGE